MIDFFVTIGLVTATGFGFYNLGYNNGRISGLHEARRIFSDLEDHLP